MDRTVSANEATILGLLELERPDLVTTTDLAKMLSGAGIATAPRVFAARLRAKGWLLPTARRGVWEFAPAALAGPYSSGDPLLGFRAFLAEYSSASCALTFQAAAWAQGLADRVPTHPEIAVASRLLMRRLPDGLDLSVFAPKLPVLQVRGVPTLAPASIIVHMCTKPSAVRSWASSAEWLPAVAAETSWPDLHEELAGRAMTVSTRTGYLLQGLRPDIAGQIEQRSASHGTTWFGPRTSVLRRDGSWQVADTLLPFNPRNLEAVA